MPGAWCASARCPRATGITAYLANGGTLEHAQSMAAHESPRLLNRDNIDLPSTIETVGKPYTVTRQWREPRRERQQWGNGAAGQVIFVAALAFLLTQGRAQYTGKGHLMTKARQRERKRRQAAAGPPLDYRPDPPAVNHSSTMP
jgi:hypothetical protein